MHHFRRSRLYLFCSEVAPLFGVIALGIFLRVFLIHNSPVGFYEAFYVEVFSTLSRSSGFYISSPLFFELSITSPFRFLFPLESPQLLLWLRLLSVGFGCFSMVCLYRILYFFFPSRAVLFSFLISVSPPFLYYTSIFSPYSGFFISDVNIKLLFISLFLWLATES